MLIIILVTGPIAVVVTVLSMIKTAYCAPKKTYAKGMRRARERKRQVTKNGNSEPEPDEEAPAKYHNASRKTKFFNPLAVFRNREPIKETQEIEFDEFDESESKPTVGFHPPHPSESSKDQTSSYQFSKFPSSFSQFANFSIFSHVIQERVDNDEQIPVQSHPVAHLSSNAASNVRSHNNSSLFVSPTSWTQAFFWNESHSRMVDR
jgi:hypothetical protein